MLSTYQWIFLQNFAKLVIYAESIGLKLTGTWLKRDLEIQKKMVANGLSKTLDSKHLKSVAIDLNVFKNDVLTFKKEDIEPLGTYWKSLHELNRWGGDFKGFGKDGDSGHFEMNV
jgi:hypothetical protein